MELVTATVDSEVEKCLHSAYGHLSWWRLQRLLSSELFADSRQTDPAGFPRPRTALEAPSASIVAGRLRVRAYFAVVVAHGATRWAAQFQLVSLTHECSLAASLRTDQAIELHDCVEPFSNDGSPRAALLKRRSELRAQENTLKITIAALEAGLISSALCGSRKFQSFWDDWVSEVPQGDWLSRC